VRLLTTEHFAVINRRVALDLCSERPTHSTLIPTSRRPVRNLSANSGGIRVDYLQQRRADPESGMSLYIKVLTRKRSTADIRCTRRYGRCPVIMPSRDACSNYATFRHSHKHFKFTATSCPSQRHLSSKCRLCTLSGHYRSSLSATTPPRRMDYGDRKKQRPMGRSHNKDHMQYRLNKLRLAVFGFRNRNA
jgi:hypothetical protein